MYVHVVRPDLAQNKRRWLDVEAPKMQRIAQFQPRLAVSLIKFEGGIVVNPFFGPLLFAPDFSFLSQISQH
jgi:hypothetical protein